MTDRDRDFYLSIRQGLLMIVDGLERFKLGTPLKTADLRKMIEKDDTGRYYVARQPRQLRASRKERGE